MGVVFLGQSAGGRLVAVKVIHAQLAMDEAFRIRFGREIAAARSVGGFYTAPVVDADATGSQPWLAVGYVDGPSLEVAVAGSGPMPEDSLLTLAAGLAEGISAVHAAGVVHRDLKPSNVMLARDGVRLIDFGIARAADDSKLTGTGMVVGSPGFMSPEQAEGRAVGPASDVFSMGAVLAYAATGQGPFGVGPPVQLLYRVVHGSPCLDALPGSLRDLAAECLDKDPGRRPTAEQFLGRLPKASRNSQLRRSPIDWWPVADQAEPASLPLTADRDLLQAPEPGEPGKFKPGQQNPPGRRRKRLRRAIPVAAIATAALAAGSLSAMQPGDSTNPPPLSEAIFNWSGTAQSMTTAAIPGDSLLPYGEVGKKSSDSWQISADCSKNNCGAFVSGSLFSYTFAMHLERGSSGRLFTGSKVVTSFSGCDPKGDSDTLSIRIAITHASPQGSAWTADKWTGSATLSIPFTRCSAETFTFALHSS
jgi:serine/threonine protein kinase